VGLSLLSFEIEYGKGDFFLFLFKLPEFVYLFFLFLLYKGSWMDISGADF